MRLPLNKFSLSLTAVALTAGLVVGAANIPHTVSVKNAGDETQTSTNQPVEATPDTSAIVPATPVTSGDAGVTSTDSGSISAAQLPAQTQAQVAQQQPAVTLVNVTESSDMNPDGTMTDWYCHYTYSDGSSQDKLAGSTPNDTQGGKVSYGILCPSE